MRRPGLTHDIASLRRLLALGIAGLAVLLQGVPATSRAQPPANAPTVEQLDSAVQAQWNRIDALVAGGQADEAIETLRRIADEHGDKLSPLPESLAPSLALFRRYIPVRDRCYARMAGLEVEVPGALAGYRRQIDPQAKRWLDQAVATHDIVLLRRILQEAYLSSHGDDALYWLGEIMLERGHYILARRAWEAIHPSFRFPENRHEILQGASRQARWLPLRNANVGDAWPIMSRWAESAESPSELAYPDTDLSRAEILARLVVVSILEGNRERAQVEIELMRRQAGEADGVLAGRKGRLVELLENLLKESQQWPDNPFTDGRPLSHPRQPGAATGFVFESARPEAPLWSARIPRLVASRELLSTNRLRVAEDADGILAYHPLVAGSTVVLQVGPGRDQVLAFDVGTGEQSFPSDLPGREDEARELTRPVLGVPRYAATALDGVGYFRVGVPISLPTGSDLRRTMPAKLVALDLAAEGRLLWEFVPDGPRGGTEWTMAGPPVTDGTQLYLTLLRRGPLRVETHVVALDARDGRSRWRRYVCAAEPPFDDNTIFLAHHMLSVRDGVVFCNTNYGAVAAIDALQGSMLWLTTYPRRTMSGTDPDRNDLHFYRDLNPPLIFQDLVIAAPMDCDRLFALDASTGIPVWVTAANVAVDAVHLLGVGARNLVVSGECLYWIDVYGGKLMGRYPEPFRPAPGFARPSPRGYGRGILAGEHVYWPVREGILVFEQDISGVGRGGQPVPVQEVSLAAAGASGGNLAIADGVLLVAGRDRLFAFQTAEHPEHGTARRSDSRTKAP